MRVESCGGGSQVSVLESFRLAAAPIVMTVASPITMRYPAAFSLTLHSKPSKGSKGQGNPMGTLLDHPNLVCIFRSEIRKAAAVNLHFSVNNVM
jgi:hypothetical protein